MDKMTIVSVMVDGSGDYAFRYEAWYVPGKGDILNHRGRSYKVKRIAFWTSDPDVADIHVKEIR